MQTPNTDTTTTARSTYEIGGTTVLMTAAAAAAWNAGDLTEDALAGAEVLLIDGTRADLWYYIGGAGGWRDCSRHMEGMPANLIGGDAAPVAYTRDAAVARLAELGLDEEYADIECLSRAEHYEWLCTADADEIVSHREQMLRDAEGGAA